MHAVTLLLHIHTYIAVCRAVQLRSALTCRCASGKTIGAERGHGVSIGLDGLLLGWYRWRVRSKAFALSALTGRCRRRERRRSRMPRFTTEWTCVLVVQPRLDAHEVKVVRALRKHRHTGARRSVVRRGRRCVACRCVSYLPPYYSRLVARSRGAWCRVIQGLMADAAEVLFRSPRPTRNRVPIRAILL